MEEEIVQKLLCTGASFVLFREPDQNKITFYAQQTADNSNLNLQNPEKGFSFYPFDPSRSEPIFLRADYETQSINTEMLGRLTFPVSGSDREEKQPGIDKSDYLNSLQNGIETMPEHGVQKFVYSCVRTVTYPGKSNALRVFSKLCHKYPAAFVYLFHHPVSGTWMGATPEVLLKNENGEARTMALAGTMPVTPGGEYVWGEKEKEEQQYVSDYIEELLKKTGAVYAKKGPDTLIAGPAAHLNTHFRIQAENNESKIADLLYDLHPTPAVCGVPKEKAMKLIRNIEKHERSYYTGFLGPVTPGGDFRMYVNLRCMKVFDDEVQIYGGGGITTDSDPESEWNEIQLKTGTIKSVLEE